MSLQKEKDNKEMEEGETKQEGNSIPYSIPKTGLVYSEKGKLITFKQFIKTINYTSIKI